MSKLTKANSHKATQRGYALGNLIEAGEIVPEGVVISDEWMEPVEGSGRRARAMQEALDPTPDDVDLTKASKSALEAIALEKGINVAGLSKDDLIAAIRAATDPTR